MLGGGENKMTKVGRVVFKVMHRGWSQSLSCDARTRGACSPKPSRALAALKETKRWFTFYILDKLYCYSALWRSAGVKRRLDKIHGKIGPSVAIKNHGADASAGSGTGPWHSQFCPAPLCAWLFYTPIIAAMRDGHEIDLLWFLH